MAVTITHIMADGTVRDSIDGLVIPLTEATKPAYMILAEARRRRIEREQADKKGNKVS